MSRRLYSRYSLVTKVTWKNRGKEGRIKVEDCWLERIEEADRKDYRSIVGVYEKGFCRVEIKFKIDFGIRFGFVRESKFWLENGRLL